MAIARRAVVLKDAPGVYHVISRCVRRAFLCGFDAFSGKSFEHRREWVRERIKELSEIFFIDVYAYAVMSNHFHAVLRTDPLGGNVVEDAEIVQRWHRLFPQKKDEQNNPVALSQSEIDLFCAQKEKLALCRERLGDLSWFMRCLNECLARRANQEDECSGCFWESRYKCQRLADEGAVLACMAYVDLNAVRAGVADSPEDSEFSSVYDRIKARQAAAKISELESVQSIEDLEKRKALLIEQRASQHKADWLFSLSAEPSLRVGTPCVSLDEYLELVDATGRSLREGKASIGAELAPILDRLDLDYEGWVANVRGYGGLFYHIAGKAESLCTAARQVGRKWFCRKRSDLVLYCSAKA